MIPILARAAREVEAAVQKGPLKPANRARFQVAALLLREERARVKADRALSDADRQNEQKRLDGLAGILAKTAARDTSLIGLLADDAPVTPAARALRRDLLIAAGVELSPDELVIANEPKPVDKQVEKQVVPASVRQLQMANPFLAPEFSFGVAAKPTDHLLTNWELIEPLFRSFEVGAGGGAATMDLPEAKSLHTPGSLDLMRHQARFVEEVRAGHRTFLLADEPGLGKTAQALLAAEASNSYPLLAVVPNVVKTNWAREVELWTPEPHRDRRARRRRGRGRLQRRRHRELRDPRPPRRMARPVRLQGHGRRRGALHQEPQVRAQQARARAQPQHPQRLSHARS